MIGQQKNEESAMFDGTRYRNTQKAKPATGLLATSGKFPGR